MGTRRTTTANTDSGESAAEQRRWWERLRLNLMPPQVDTVHPSGGTGAIVREGNLVTLRRHTGENRAAFQRWYADHDIARLLRHDLKPLSYVQSLVYFDTVIMPSSALGLTCAIHDRESGELIGTTGLTDIQDGYERSCYFRIVIGESRFWNRGFGSETTRLMLREAFERHYVDVVNLEVFDYNERAIKAYSRVGFVQRGEHIEWPELGAPELHVLEMQIDRDTFYANDK